VTTTNRKWYTHSKYDEIAKNNFLKFS